jgi:hypothetical protein
MNSKGEAKHNSPGKKTLCGRLNQLLAILKGETGRKRLGLLMLMEDVPLGSLITD